LKCVFVPQAFIPDISRLNQEGYYFPFIDHLKSHLSMIETYNLNVYSSSNYFFDTSYINNPKFKQFKQLFIDILFKKLIPILNNNVIKESDECCNIQPDIVCDTHQHLKDSFLKLLNNINSEITLILGFEDIKHKEILINKIIISQVKNRDDWFKYLDELSYYDYSTLHLSIEILSFKTEKKIKRNFTISEKYFESISKCDEKTKRNILTTMIDALISEKHKSEKLSTGLFRKDIDKSHRLTYEMNDSYLNFLLYGDHDTYLN